MKLKAIILLLTFVVPTHAEDWTTSDGKTYKSVTVVKVEDDAVTILDSDGGARIPLSSLPPELQRRFNYDPEKAKAAADQRAADDKASAQVAQAEIEQGNSAKQTKLIAEQTSEINREHGISAAQQAQEMQTACKPIYAEVIQVLPDGLLVDPFTAGIDPATEEKGISFQGGHWASVDQGTTVYSPSGITIFIKNAPAGSAEGDKITLNAYRDGTYSYLDTMGSERTIQQWVFVPTK